jgi:Ca2+-binding RTX toxin-like protein
MASTITGGATVSTASPQEQASANNAYNAAVAMSGDTSSQTSGSISPPPNNSTYTVAQFTPTDGGSYKTNPNEPGVVLQGSTSASLKTGNGTMNQVIVGNSGNDTITTTGGMGTVILGSGVNKVVVDGGQQNIVTTGSNTQTISAENGASLDISGTANVNVDFQAGRTVTNTVTGATRMISGNDTISTSGTANINVAGNDTITLGMGTDTVKALGAATVYGGSGSLVMNAASGGTLYAGSGAETLVGGSTGALNFYGSTSTSSTDVVKGGAGVNSIEGGAGSDTLVSGTAVSSSATDVFEFASSIAGGTHTIDNFTSGSDQIDLHGYSQGQETTTFSGANTVIKLADNTTITVNNVHLSQSDINFH